MKPLEGLLVVAVEQAVAAPLCTARLAAAGARVVKIERPGGDFARGYDGAARGESSYFVWLNQGKESVVLDFKEADDAALLDDLIMAADVFVQNLAPGALERAGFGSEALRERKPALITCDISGYGEAEAWRDMKAYDLLVQAESGLVAVSGGPESFGRIGVSICDIGAGMTAHAAILEALYRRSRCGEGAGLKLSLFDVAAEWMTVPLIHNDYGAGTPAREGLRHPSIAPYGAYASAAGEEVIVSIQNEREWHRFCRQVLEREKLAGDPRFCSNALRVANRDALDREILSVTTTLSLSAFRRRLRDASIAFGSVNSVAAVSGHDALRRHSARNRNGEIVKIPAPPVRWSDPAAGETGSAPALGQHTEAVRRAMSKTSMQAPDMSAGHGKS